MTRVQRRKSLFLLGFVIAVATLVIAQAEYLYEAIALAASGAVVLLRLRSHKPAGRRFFLGVLVAGLCLVGILYAFAWNRIRVVNKSGAVVFDISMNIRVSEDLSSQILVNNVPRGASFGFHFFDIFNDGRIQVQGSLVDGTFFHGYGLLSGRPAFLGGVTDIVLRRNGDDVVVEID